MTKTHDAIKLVRVALAGRKAVRNLIPEIMEKTGLDRSECFQALERLCGEQISATQHVRPKLDGEHMGDAIARYTQRARAMVEVGMTPSGACNIVYQETGVRVSL